MMLTHKHTQNLEVHKHENKNDIFILNGNKKYSHHVDWLNQLYEM